MKDRQEETLQLSGLQHFAFCRRQWALIHLEGQWAENLRTVEGELMHSRAHEDGLRERRGDVLTIRGLAVYSRRLGLTGKCDVVEFHMDSAGVGLQGEDGMCLEEMLCCQVPEGALFYGETRRREQVSFTVELRAQVEAMTTEMQDYARRGYTPEVKPRKGCAACSLKEICLPAMKRSPSASAYLAEYISGEGGS